MKKLLLLVGTAAGFSAAFAGDVTQDGVRTLTDTTLEIASEADLGAGVTNVVLDNATVSYNLTKDQTLTSFYTVTGRGGNLGAGPAAYAATIASTKFLKPNLGKTFGKTGKGTMKIGTPLGKVTTPTRFIVREGTVRLTSGDFFGGHSDCTTNFVIDVREGATWHNGTSHGAVGPVELTGATWISDNPSPYGGTWADTSFKGGITVHPSSTPSKMYATSWFFLTQPLASNPDADKCVIDVETGAELYVYGDLYNGSGQTSVLVKRGGGTLYLLGKGSWTGGTRLEGGKIVLGNANALGTSAITIAGDVEIAVDPGVTVTCPELKGTGHVTVSGKGGITFTKKAEAVTGATDKVADPYSPLSGMKLTVGPGVTDVSITGTTPLTVNNVVELHPGCASLADIRKTGAGTLKLGTGLAGKYRKLLVTGGVVEFADNSCFGMSGVGNKGGVEISGGKIRPTADYRSPKTRFTFTGENGGLDVPAGVLFEASSNYFYSANATVTKTGAGGWQLVSCFYSNLTPVSGTRWVVEEGRLFTAGGGTFSGHSAVWNGTIEVHENGEFANDSANHQPVGHLVLRGGTVRTEISQFADSTFNVEGGGTQWGGFSFNGGIKVLASEKPSRVIARQCYVTQEALSGCEVDVDEGAILEMDTALRGGFTWSPSFRWQRGLFAKTGKGTLRLLRPLSLTGYAGSTVLKGLLDVREGTLELKEGGSLDPNAEIRVSPAAKIVLNDGTRFVAQNVAVAPAVVSEAEVWIDATRVSAKDGDTLSTIDNLGTCGGNFKKFPKAIGNSGGMIPNAPQYVTKGIGGKPSFFFDGQMALALDSYTNMTDNCEIFVVARWTSYEATDGKGRWGGVVSLGSVKMTGNEDQHNFGVLSSMVDGGSAGKFGSMSVIFGTPEGQETSGANHATASLGSTLLSPGVSTNEAFVLRIQRGSTAGNSEMWLGDSRGAKSNSSTYTERLCRIDRVCIGSRLMTGGLATTYNTLAKSRNIIGQVGEFLVFSKKLSETERAAVNDYLRRKWIGTAAEETSALAEGKTGTLEVETPAGAKASVVAGLAGDGQRFAVAKTGAGELTVGGGADEAALDVNVREGTIRLQDGKLASRVPVWIDADDAETCLMDATGHVTNLVNKGFCGGAFGQALTSGKTPHFPVRTAAGMNGRATLTFDGESAMMLSTYTNTTSPRRFSIYCVQRRNQWKLHPGADNGGGYGKWATVCTFVPEKCAQDEMQPGAYHVDESPETSSYAHLDYQNGKAVTSKAIPHPGTGVDTIFVSQVTTNGYMGAYVTAATADDKVVSKGAGGLKLGPYKIERVILGARANDNSKVHYYGTDHTANRCWYGELAELIVTTEPLALQEEMELMAYLRKKWLNKGSGSATPPAWLSGESATPQFGVQTTLAMADGTCLRHEAGEVTLGALETAGTVDWTRVWSGEKADFPMFKVDDVSLNSVNLMPVPAVRKEQVEILGYGAKGTAPTWQVFRPDGRARPYATVTDTGSAFWLLDQMGSLLLLK